MTFEQAVAYTLDQERAAPAPQAPFSLEDQPRPATDEARSPGQTEPVRVVGAGAERVNRRAASGTTGARLKGLVDGTQLEVIGPDRTVAGRTWRNVRDPADRSEGWVAAEFVAPP